MGAVQIIIGVKAEEWIIPESQQPEYVEVITKRLPNLLHVVQQGCLKQTAPMWVQELPWNGGEHNEASPFQEGGQ